MQAVDHIETRLDRAAAVKTNLRYGAWLRANQLLGRLTPLSFIPKVARAIGMRRRWTEKRALLHAGALSDALVREWMTDNVDRVDGTVARKLRDHAVDAEKIENSDRYGMVQKGAALLKAMLDQNDGVFKSAANVGARIDPTFAYMSSVYPGVEFISIDMQDTIAESNACFEPRPNWTFRSMYALAGFRDGEVRSDLVYMTSTSPKFNTLELQQYLKAFKSARVKAVIFNEPWWIFPLGLDSFRVTTPDHISSAKARLGGFLADYHHNYIATLAKAGFTTVHAVLRAGTVSSGGAHHHLQVVAVNDDDLSDVRFDVASAR